MKQTLTIGLLTVFGLGMQAQNPSGIKNADVIAIGKFVDKKDTVIFYSGPTFRLFFFFRVNLRIPSQVTHTIYTFQVDSIIRGELTSDRPRIIGRFEVDSAHTYDTDTRMLLLNGPRTYFGNDPNLFYWFYTNSTNHQPKSKKTKIPIRRVDHFLEE
jgi:hypothetical protein